MTGLEIILRKLKNSDSDWLKVNEERCIHRYFDDFYILLCHWYDAKEKRNLVYVEVDNINDMIDDVVKERYFEGSEEYKRLLPIYNMAIQVAIPVVRLNAS